MSVQRSRHASPGTLRSVLDAFVPAAMVRAGVPGVAVGLRAGPGEVLAGYGVTSVEHPLPVHGETLFQIGSVSKTFTATALMALVERGQLALDDPVCRYLPSFRLYAPDGVVALEPPDQAGLVGEFGRDARGRVAWLRWGGRMAPRFGD